MARYQVGDNVLNALIKQESGGNRNAISPKGARGLTQIMPETAANPGYGVTPLQDNSEAEQIRFTKDYMGALLEKNGGDLNKALAAYNAGQGNVNRYGGVPPFKETQSYVKNIMKSINPVGEAQAEETSPIKLPPGFVLDKPTQEAQATQPTQIKLPPGFVLDKVTEPDTAEQPGIMERAGKNLPQDLTNIGQGVIDTISHPINAIENLGAVARGGMQSALPDSTAQYLIDKGITPESRPQFKQFAEPLVKTVTHPLESFAEAPASTFLNATGLLSAGTGLTKAALGKAAARTAVEDVANVAKKNALMAPKRAILEEAHKLDFVVPKSEIAPSFINNRLEGFAGKAALNQESILRNQAAVSAQARKVLGVAEDVPINGKVIKDAIQAQYKPYEDVANIPTPPSLAHGYSINTHTTTNSQALLTELKQARKDSQKWYKTAEAQGGNPEIEAKAKALSARAKAIETEFENRAIASGKPELVQKMRDARTKIAQVYDVDAARNVASGEIDPRIIGAKLDKAPDRMTGELKQIGEFQQQFPKYAKAGENVQTPGVSKIEAVAAIGGYGLLGAIGGMLPFASTPVRNMLLSKWYQNKLLKAMEHNPSKVKAFMNNATNKTINKNALLGLVASDKEQK